MKHLLLAASAAVLLLSSSCNKDGGKPSLVPNGNNPITHNTALSQYTDALRVQPKTISIDAAAGGSFRGNSGARYVFPPYAFTTAAGVPVSGTVQLTVSEWLTHSQMMFAKMIPVSNGAPLNSGGEYFVKATQNGNNLILAPGATYQVKLPYTGTNGIGMNYFIGENTTDTTTTVVNWNQGMVDSSQGGGQVILNGDTLNVFSDSLGYGNADQFLANPNYQEFTVHITMPAGVTVGSIGGNVLYDTYNSMWFIGSYDSASQSFATTHIPDIPVHFVVYAVGTDGNFYGGIGAATPVTGATYTVAMSATTVVAFAALVDALP